jgi:hypothetical protein
MTVWWSRRLTVERHKRDRQLCDKKKDGWTPSAGGSPNDIWQENPG